MGGTDQGLTPGSASVIRTARLLLRAPVPDDAPAIFATYSSDPEAVRYMSFPRHEKVSTTEWFISMALHEWKTHGTGTHVIVRDGDIIGSTGLHAVKEQPGHVMTGYILGRAFWGQGYATEACRAMIELARTRGDHLISSYCHRDHVASAHVLEKCGFVFQGIVPRDRVLPNLGPDPQDARRYALDLA
jgi:ribosomal-protein-alanine N-acetyltransferase